MLKASHFEKGLDFFRLAKHKVILFAKEYLTI